MAASSSSSSAAAKKYDVFICFRGEDTRHSFTSHLYQALCRYSIKAYIDCELNKGDDISPSLIQAIQDSYGSLVVFSQNYASSKWCLNELLKILECKKEGHFVLPVFYNVDPSHVRKQIESYGEAFAKHEQDSNNNEIMLQKWRAALTETANIVGWDSQSIRDEPELIQNIVIGVLDKLDHICQPSKLGLVGIDERCEHIEALLRNFPVVGIWGMGGIGKTTIAKAIIDKLSPHYDSCCFFKSIGEESHRKGPNQLQGTLLHELLKDDIISINQHKVVGLNHAIRRLKSKKIFIVFDDVNNCIHLLDDLRQICESLGPQSRVIITTRDKQLLKNLNVKQIYEVERLNNEESLELFRLNAFNKDYPDLGYEKITKKFVSYTKGTPLALKILGLFLLSKTKEEWKSTWNKLKKIPNEDIEKVLRLSYDGLNHEEQQIFLDIACFFKGEKKEKVINLLNGFGFHGTIGLRNLEDKALLTISHENVVQMHDLIQEMGWEIVRKESINEPGRRSRLWNPKEVYDVLKYNKGTDAIQGLILDASKIEDLQDLHLSVDTFAKMMNLRFLRLFYSSSDSDVKIHVPVNIQSFSHKLRYLNWDRYPLRSLDQNRLWSISSNFCAEKLVKLKMQHSNIIKLWNGVQDLVNLKSLNLRGSEQLIELPNFSKASSLKSVKLCGCKNLCYIHPSILSLHTLETLDLVGCENIRSLQSDIHLKSLEYLHVGSCSHLKKFSLTSEKIRYLEIYQTAINILHSSVGRCSNLERLKLSHSAFKNLPIDLLKLKSLKSLSVCGCENLDTLNFHIGTGSLLSLREIHLSYCFDLCHLPDNIKYLSCLAYLHIESCQTLPNIPEFPPSIETLYVTDCRSLETIIAPKPSECRQSFYFLENCLKLDERSLSHIIEIVHFRIKQAALCEVDSTPGSGYAHKILFPGNTVPSWFRYRTAQNRINIEIPPRSHLLGFAFYCILLPFQIQGNYMSPCGCYCYLENDQFTHFSCNWVEMPLYARLSSDHVYIWYDQLDCYKFFDAMNGQRANGQSTKKLSFEFYVCAEFGGHMTKKNAIKECGVWPIYASEYDISINDWELRLGIKLGYKTDEIDEQVELQFNELRPKTSVTGFTSSVFDRRDQDIFSQNTRFNGLDCSSQMELSLESAPGNKSKRCQDIDEFLGGASSSRIPFFDETGDRFSESDYSASHAELSLECGSSNKSMSCQDIDELLGRASTSGISVGCSEFTLKPRTQTNELVSQSPPAVISMQNDTRDLSEKSSCGCFIGCLLKCLR